MEEYHASARQFSQNVSQIAVQDQSRISNQIMQAHSRIQLYNSKVQQYRNQGKSERQIANYMRNYTSPESEMRFIQQYDKTRLDHVHVTVTWSGGGIYEFDMVFPNLVYYSYTQSDIYDEINRASQRLSNGGDVVLQYFGQQTTDNQSLNFQNQIRNVRSTRVAPQNIVVSQAQVDALRIQTPQEMLAQRRAYVQYRDQNAAKQYHVSGLDDILQSEHIEMIDDSNGYCCNIALRRCGYISELPRDCTFIEFEQFIIANKLAINLYNRYGSRIYKCSYETMDKIHNICINEHHAYYITNIKGFISDMRQTTGFDSVELVNDQIFNTNISHINQFGQAYVKDRVLYCYPDQIDEYEMVLQYNIENDKQCMSFYDMMYEILPSVKELKKSFTPCAESMINPTLYISNNFPSFCPSYYQYDMKNCYYQILMNMEHLYYRDMTRECNSGYYMYLIEINGQQIWIDNEQYCQGMKIIQMIEVERYDDAILKSIQNTLAQSRDKPYFKMLYCRIIGMMSKSLCVNQCSQSGFIIHHDDEFLYDDAKYYKERQGRNCTFISDQRNIIKNVHNDIFIHNAITSRLFLWNMQFKDIASFVHCDSIYTAQNMDHIFNDCLIYQYKDRVNYTGDKILKSKDTASRKFNIKKLITVHDNFAGCGKTYQILQKCNDQSLVLCPFNTMLSKYRDAGIKCCTMSYMYNVRTLPDGIRDIYVDEYYIINTAEIKILLCLGLLGYNVICYGDSQQLLPINHYELSYETKSMIDTISDHATFVNRRNGFTAEYYEKLIKSRDRDWLCEQILLNMTPFDRDVQYISLTNSKRQLINTMCLQKWFGYHTIDDAYVNPCAGLKIIYTGNYKHEYLCKKRIYTISDVRNGVITLDSGDIIMMKNFCKSKYQFAFACTLHFCQGNEFKWYCDIDDAELISAKDNRYIYTLISRTTTQ